MAPRFVAGERSLRQPTQARSIASRERLLDAAERLFSRHGYEETSVGQIVQEAQVSVGVFYSRFVDKAEIFRAAQERVLQRILATWAVALDRARGEAVLAGIITVVVTDLNAFLRANEPMLRVIGTRNLADERVGAISRSVGRLLVAPLSELLLQHRDEIKHPNPDLAVDVGFRMVYATLQQTIQYGDVQPTEQSASWEQLADELARAYLAYLGVAA